MEDIMHIKSLLERFYNGETTLDEERELENFFRKSSVPEDLLADKDLFLSLASSPDNIEIPEEFNQGILDAIDQSEKSEQKTRRISLYSLSGLAAGLLVLISVYVFYLKDNPHSFIAGNSMADTYQDPMEAYEEAKRTLAYVSDKFNTGTSELQRVKKMNNETFGNLQPLTFISKGSREVMMLKQLEKAGRIE